LKKTGLEAEEMTNEDKPAPRRIDLRNEGVHWDLGESQSYSEYLQLDKVLNAQKPNSIEQDEMLFIIVHQVSELWMRLFLHELGAVFECVRRDNLDPSFKMLARISRLQEELIGAWSVLSTLTPVRVLVVPQHARSLLGLSVGAVPAARVHAGQQESRHDRRAEARSARVRATGACARGAVHLRRRCCACCHAAAMVFPKRSSNAISPSRTRRRRR
jgi:hypothetical protein